MKGSTVLAEDRHFRSHQFTACLSMLVISALSVAVAVLAITLHTQDTPTVKVNQCTTTCSPPSFGVPGMAFCSEMVAYLTSHGFHLRDDLAIPAELQGPGFTVENICVEHTTTYNHSALAMSGVTIPTTQKSSPAAHSEQKQFGLLLSGVSTTVTLFDSAKPEDHSTEDVLAAIPASDYSFVGWQHQTTQTVTYNMAATFGVGAKATYHLEFDYHGRASQGGPEQQFLLNNVKVIKDNVDIGYTYGLTVTANFDTPYNAAANYNPDNGVYEPNSDYDWNGRLIVAAIRARLHFQAHSLFSTVTHNCEVLILGTGQVIAEDCDPNSPN